MATVADVFALFFCLFSMISKATLLLIYRRLPLEQKNTHFWFYLFISFCFAVICLIIGIAEFVSPQLLDCTFFPTIFIFMLFENLSDTCLIGYALSFFPGYNSVVLLMGSVVTALICTTIKLVLIYNPKATVDSCHATFISSRDGIISAVTVQLICFVVMLLLATSVYIYKFKENRTERAFCGRKCLVNITLIGSVAVMIPAIFGVIEYETSVSLLKYSYLIIIYSVESCLICVVAVVLCPMAQSSLMSIFSHKVKKAKVDTLPRQQLYCSMSLRSPHPQPHKKKACEDGSPTTDTEAREETVIAEIDGAKGKNAPEIN